MLAMGMENGAPISGKIENLTHFYNRGIRYITLTHAKDNHISDSSYDTTHTWKGLSEFGEKEVAELNRLGIQIKLDLVLNHLSVRSPQFTDLLKNGNESPYRDFFIDWNAFWKDHGTMGENDHVVPHKEHLDKLFMRKPGLPILMLRFPDGSLQAYWNTFYQKVSFDEITAQAADQWLFVLPQLSVLRKGTTGYEVGLPGSLDVTQLAINP